MVKVYDNVIPGKACKSFIDLFENNETHQEYIDYNGCPCFTQLNLNQLSPNIVRSLIPYLAQVYRQYKKDVKSKLMSFCHCTPSVNSVLVLLFPS